MTSCKVQNLPKPLQFSAGVFDSQKEDSFPLICGGSSYLDNNTNSCWKLEKSGDWTTISSMKYKRSNFTLNAIDGRIFAIGGKNFTGENDMGLQDVEIFDYSKWSDKVIEDIPVPIHSHCTVAYNSTLLVVIAGVQYGKVKS